MQISQTYYQSIEKRCKQWLTFDAEAARRQLINEQKYLQAFISKFKNGLQVTRPSPKFLLRENKHSPHVIVAVNISFFEKRQFVL